MTKHNNLQRQVRTSRQQKALNDGLEEFINARLLRGDEAYMLTLMFVTLEGNEASVARQMNKIAEKIYSRVLTRLVKHPRRTPLEQMPLWLSCADWPVQKTTGMTATENLTNGGRHLHAMVFVPQNVRTGERLSEIIDKDPSQFLVGSALTRLHAMSIERTAVKATGYALKSVSRRRSEWEDVLILPKHGSEMGHRESMSARPSQTRIDLIARAKAWSEGR